MRSLAPRTLANACLRRAWDEDTDDKSRKLLEHASLCIEQLMARLLSNAQCLEIVEAELASRQFPLLNDEDDPGMAL